MPEHAPPPAAFKYGSYDEATVAVVVMALHTAALLDASKVYGFAAVILPPE
jgi:hypothetical protein